MCARVCVWTGRGRLQGLVAYDRVLNGKYLAPLLTSPVSQGTKRVKLSNSY